MSDPNTIHILSFDGGGERGYLSTQFLAKFVQLWGVDPAKLFEQFDVICGTSVGGILALSLAFGKSINDGAAFFTDQGPYIFSLGTSGIPPPSSPPIPLIRPNALEKAALLAADIPFYQSSGTYEFEYGAGLLTSTIESEFGTNTLQELSTNVIIPSYEYDTGKYVLFSNLLYPDFIGQDELISNVALATSAAPAYLPPKVFNGHTYLDGGIYQNNPASFGRTLAQIIKPTASRCCMLSVGTGLGETGFDPGSPLMRDGRVTDMVGEMNVEAFNTISTLFQLFSIATIGGQESVAKNMFLESTYALNQFYYYRFQPLLDPNVDTELDNADPATLAYYDTVADDYFNNDIQNISAFLGHLTA